jgi:hypothetical protein
MSDLDRRGSHPDFAARPGVTPARPIAARPQHGVRSLAAAVLGSLCLMSCLAAAAQADVQQHAAATPSAAATAPADITAGGWKLVGHGWPPYTEVLANKSMTTTVANAPITAAQAVCGSLARLGPVGGALAVFCIGHFSWAKGVARDALRQNRCFRWVLPANQVGLAYPTTYTGSWCR